MTYTLKQSDWQWLIETDQTSNRSVLRCKRPTSWTECNTYDSPEAAAAAVATGKTGQKDWDDMKHEAPFPNLSAWLMDPTGGIIPPILPIIKDLVRAVVQPSKSPEAGKA